MASIERRATSLMDQAFQKNDDSLRFANWENTDLQGENLVRDCVKSLILGWSISAHIANLRADTQIYSEDTMAEMKRTTDDEIDLIELFEILWNGKLFILTVTIFATIVGVAYAQFSKPVYVPKYKIAVPYVNVISYGSSNETKLGFILDSSWTLEGSQFTKTETNPVAAKTYLSQLENVNNALTAEVLSEAELELRFLKKSVEEMVQLTFSERMMFDILGIERLIFKLENGTKAIRLGDVSIAESMPPLSKDELKIALAFVLGLFVSMAFVLIKNAFQQRRRLSK